MFQRQNFGLNAATLSVAGCLEPELEQRLAILVDDLNHGALLPDVENAAAHGVQFVSEFGQGSGEFT